MSQQYKDILKKYIPDKAVDIIYHTLKKHNAQLHIKYNRKTKSGDYRPPHGRIPYHRISINHGLNPYHFLITLIHEIAHLKVWEMHKNKALPHGLQWKNEFGNLLFEFMVRNVFPEDITTALNDVIKNPKATTYNEDKLLRILKQYDKDSNKIILEDIPINGHFELEHGRVFLKMEKLRKYYKAKEISSNKIYRIHQMAEVKSVSKI